jgi:putative acetyltransferase
LISIRPEKREDHTAVYRVNELAFGQPNEADLVDALREKAAAFISLVATVDDNVVGHIFFSPVTVESEETAFSAMGLAPMAVLPTHKNQGVGSLLFAKG